MLHIFKPIPTSRALSSSSFKVVPSPITKPKASFFVCQITVRRMSSGSNYIQKIAFVGAGGNSGKPMVEALVKNGKHSITALTRADSKSEIPAGVKVANVDYSDHDALVDVLKGHDALVVTMGSMAPKDTEKKIIQAASDAGVPWVLPNEWSPDTANEPFSHEFLVGDHKKDVRQFIETLPNISYIAVSTGFWYEWSLAIAASYGFDFKNKAITLFDDGDVKINTSTWPQIGRAVASLLSLKINPDGRDDKSPTLSQFKNGYVYISSFRVSQKDMLESVLRVTSTKESDWKITKEPTMERYQAGVAEMKSGNRMGFVKGMYTRIFFPDAPGDVETTKGLANDLLGLPKEDLDESTKGAIERSKTLGW